MNALSRMPQRELERLSAYLDGVLPEREAARLELRLQENASLREALEELRKTTQLLASLPALRVPRNFTLTPQMVGRVERPPAYPVMRLATALASLALVLVLGFDMLSGSLAQSTRAVQSIERVTLEEEAVAEAPMAVAEMPVERPEGEQMADGLTAQEVAPAAQAPVAGAEGEGDSLRTLPTPAPEYLEGASEPPPPAEMEKEAAMPATKTAQPTQEAAPALGEAMIEATLPGEPLRAGATPSPEPIPTPSASYAESPRASAWPPLRLVELGLGLLVVSLAVFTYRLRKRSL